MDRANFYNQTGQFKIGRTQVTDEHQIQLLPALYKRAYLREDRHIVIAQITVKYEVNVDTVHPIGWNKPDCHNTSATWDRRQLTENDKETRQTK